jgi:hypothetical protein
MKPTGPGPETGENISARDVVDGVRLIAEYREKGIDVIARQLCRWPTVQGGALHRRPDRPDGFGVDLLVAESVHQLSSAPMRRARR